MPLAIPRGGIFAHHLACEKSNIFSGVASYAGTMSKVVSQSCDLKRPLDILVVHASEDQVIPIDGMGTGSQTLLSAPETVSHWRNFNGCDSSVETRPFKRKGEELTVVQSQNCENESRVHLIRWHGGSHAWPSDKIRIEDLILSFFGLDN